MPGASREPELPGLSEVTDCPADLLQAKPRGSTGLHELKAVMEVVTKQRTEFLGVDGLNVRVHRRGQSGTTIFGRWKASAGKEVCRWG